MDDILKAIKEPHILHAIVELDKYGWPAKRDSTKYDLLYDDKRYPPKEIIRYAGIAVTGEEPVYFGVGKESNHLLMRNGFTIVDKITGLPIEGSPQSKSSKSEKMNKLREEQRELEKIDENPAFSETEKTELLKIRIGQGLFRKSLLAVHASCALCNVSNRIRSF